MRRFLQHVLPNRFVKVRYYGLLSPGNRKLLAQARELLAAPAADSHTTARETRAQEPTVAPSCPHCGALLTLIRQLKPRSGVPP